jgi:hypothetical protein
MRSPRGASADLLRAARTPRVTLLATAPLCFEYESVCRRPDHVVASGLDASGVEVFLAAIVEPVEILVHVAPALLDPGDELVLVAAINGRAAAMAAFNRRDFQAAASRFGMEILLTSETIRRLP